MKSVCTKIWKFSWCLDSLEFIKNSREFSRNFTSRSRSRGIFISLFTLDLDFKSFSFHFSLKIKTGHLNPYVKLNFKASLFSFHSFREWKVKSKCLEIEIESEKWNENAPRSRSRSEIGKKFSRILEKRDSRRVLE